MDIMHTYYYYIVPLYAINVVGLVLTVNTPYIYGLITLQHVRASVHTSSYKFIIMLP